MEYSITKSYYFAAAHKLLPQEIYEKCSKLHGHSYRVDVTIVSEKLTNGMVLNFNFLDTIVNPVIEQLDHSFLNDSIGLPTAENICLFILCEIRRELGKFDMNLVLKEVSVWESQNTKTSLKNSL